MFFFFSKGQFAFSDFVCLLVLKRAVNVFCFPGSSQCYLFVWSVYFFSYKGKLASVALLRSRFLGRWIGNFTVRVTIFKTLHHIRV